MNIGGLGIMKRSLKKLYSKNPYNDKGSNQYFLDGIRDTTRRFFNQSDYYQKICELHHFQIEDIKTMEDLYKIPPIPTLFFKRNDISIEHNSIIEVTSSGTSGKCSKVTYSAFEIIQMAKMSIRLGILHNLFSILPTHYIILGYQPTKQNKTVISKTAYLSTWYALGLTRTYALKYSGNEYKIDLSKLIKVLVKRSKGILPIRIIGFPSYLYFMLSLMKENNIKLKLPKGSRILLGGGWKQFFQDEISKNELFNMIYELLGVKIENIHEFFGAAEHPVLYCTCKNHHFHIPVYGRVIIRDVQSLEPLPKGRVGLVNLLTPIGGSIPIMSVITDDLGILHDSLECNCGIKSDYLELLGRVGVTDIKTCSQGAKEYWRG